MSTPLPPAASIDPTIDLQARFLVLLPRVELHGRIYFRHLRCPEARREAVAEMVALCWRWFVRLAGRGRDAANFPSVLAGYAARAVRSGRRLCGQESGKDVLSPVAQRRRGFAVAGLPTCNGREGNRYDEALQDNGVSPVPEQVAFRIDFPAWRRTHPGRDRRLIDRLLLGERTLKVSRAFCLSPARVSQKRRQFRDDWRAFCGEASARPIRPPQGA